MRNSSRGPDDFKPYFENFVQVLRRKALRGGRGDAGVAGTLGCAAQGSDGTLDRRMWLAPSGVRCLLGAQRSELSVPGIVPCSSRRGSKSCALVVIRKALPGRGRGRRRPYGSSGPDPSAHYLRCAFLFAGWQAICGKGVETLDSVFGYGKED